MDRKRQIGLSAGILSVALGAGHLVETSTSSRTATTTPAPTGIVQLSATPDLSIAAKPVAVAATAKPRAIPAPVRTSLQAAVDAAPAQPPVPTLAATDSVPAKPAPATPAPATFADTCPQTLSATPLPGAVLSLALVAPCDGGARVVLRHGGLAVTGRLSAAGTLFTTLPAMDPAGEVAAMFPDGTRATAVAATDMAGIRRFAVQWQADDAFQIHAYENGAQFGAPGHVSAETPVGEGQLALLGDATVDLPLLAQVYTYPVPGTPVNVTVESAVTDKTCARELLAEAVESAAGRVTTTEITLAMPDCSGVGDFLVLNNLAGGTTLAAVD